MQTNKLNNTYFCMFDKRSPLYRQMFSIPTFRSWGKTAYAHGPKQVRNAVV